MAQISVLCICPGSNYLKVPGLDLWDEIRDAWNFSSGNKVIAHPPCAQWGKLKGLSRYDKRQKDLAAHCLDWVIKNGGVLEHPGGSTFFRDMGIARSELRRVFQSDWGYQARKETLLYFSQVEMLEFPMTWELPGRKLETMSKKDRALMPLSFCEYLVKCVA